MIALIDYGSGNLRSVQNALRHEGAEPQLVSDARALSEADVVVLPGVGAFGDCVDGLRTRGLWDPLREWLAADKPFLGICVGYQLLFDESEESPGVAGFGHFAGRVKRCPGLYVMDGALIEGHTGLANPSFTIAALAERCMDQILQRDRLNNRP